MSSKTLINYISSYLTRMIPDVDSNTLKNINHRLQSLVRVNINPMDLRSLKKLIHQLSNTVFISLYTINYVGFIDTKSTIKKLEYKDLDTILNLYSKALVGAISLLSVLYALRDYINVTVQDINSLENLTKYLGKELQNIILRNVLRIYRIYNNYKKFEDINSLRDSIENILEGIMFISLVHPALIYSRENVISIIKNYYLMLKDLEKTKDSNHIKAFLDMIYQNIASYLKNDLSLSTILSNTVCHVSYIDQPFLKDFVEFMRNIFSYFDEDLLNRLYLCCHQSHKKNKNSGGIYII